MRNMTRRLTLCRRAMLIVWSAAGLQAADPGDLPVVPERSAYQGPVEPPTQSKPQPAPKQLLTTSGPRFGSDALRVPSRGAQETAFAWDALLKEANLAQGKVAAHFTFHLTNVTDHPVTINRVRTSCGCTVVKLPEVPWEIGAGESGKIEVDVDGRGKFGVITKTVTVQSSAGYRYLTVRVSLPARSARTMSLSQRSRNMRLALADRQAVFEKSCAKCHVAPGVGKAGRELYEAVCGVCHEAEHRASMVPNLRALHKPQPREYWQRWVTQGKDRTLMPAWAKVEGGALTDEQIESLVDYLSGLFQTENRIASGEAASKPE